MLNLWKIVLLSVCAVSWNSTTAQVLNERKKDILFNECLKAHGRASYYSFRFREAPSKIANNPVQQLERAQWVSSHSLGAELELIIVQTDVNRFGEPIFNDLTCQWSVPEYILLDPSNSALKF